MESSNTKHKVSINLKEKPKVDQSPLKSNVQKEIPNELKAKIKAFDLEWSFGSNYRTGLINLTKNHNSSMIFAASNNIFLTEYKTKSSFVLEGHQSTISSLKTDSKGLYLVSVDDSINDRRLIIWDLNLRSEVFSLNNLYPQNSLVKICLSHSGEYLLTLGFNFKIKKYSLDIWLWKLQGQSPNGTCRIYGTEFGLPKRITTQQNNDCLIMVVFEKKVIFLEWFSKDNSLKIVSQPALNIKELGHLIRGTYVLNCHEAFAASTKGRILIFGSTIYCKPLLQKDLNNNKIYKNSIKIVKNNVAITIFKSFNGLLVVATSAGEIMFFDHQVTIVCSLCDFNLKSIRSVAFGLDRIKELEVPQEFLVMTKSSNIYFIDSSKKTCQFLLYNNDDEVSCIGCHPEEGFLVISFLNGRISLFNSHDNEQIATLMLQKIVSVIKFCPVSWDLICGTKTGEIWFLDPILLTPRSERTISEGRKEIVELIFTEDGQNFAYYDVEGFVYVFSYQKDEFWKLKDIIKPHFKPIRGMVFYGTNTLGTIGLDRKISKCHVEEPSSCLEDNLDTISTPHSCTIWTQSSNTYLIISNNLYKYQVYLLKKDKWVQKGTFVGPILKNELVRKMEVFLKNQKMLFMTSHYLGIQLLPLTGNPFHYVKTLAHPILLSDFCISHDGKHVFTFGHKDLHVLKWKINSEANTILKEIGGQGLQPFRCYLKDNFLEEMEKLFFYMQILREKKQVDDFLNISDVPDLMRACGYFPSEAEIDCILSVARFKDFEETGRLNEDISFVDFVQLFVNFKPVFGYTLEEVKEAFRVLSGNEEESVEVDEFVRSLSSMGEEMSVQDLAVFLQIVMGRRESFSTLLPARIGVPFFINEVLGVTKKYS